VHVRARATSKLEGTAPADGALVVTPVAGRAIRVPWTIVFGRLRPAELTTVRLSQRAFAPSDAAPALLSFVAGSVRRSAAASDVLPLSRLDLELWSPAGGRIGLLARLRDVLPGRYSFGVTGRDPTGSVLPSGDYQLRLVAFGTDARTADCADNRFHDQVGSAGPARNVPICAEKGADVTTVDAPVSHLRENPYEIAKSQLRKVAKTFAIDPNLVNVLQMCKKAVSVSIPVAMDDGTTQVFEGYRVTHNVARGPSKGGHPLSPGCHVGRGQVARDVDDVEVRAFGHPVRRCKGRRDLQSEDDVRG